MENYPSNSHKAKDGQKKEKQARPEPKKIEKVVEGRVFRRKKPLGKRFAETFVGGDAKGVWGYVVMDVLIPAAKDMVSDAVSQGVEKMLFGEVRRGRSTAHSRSSSSYTNYTRYSSPIHRREEPRERMSRRARSNHDFDEIVLETRVEAEEVIDGLFALISQYETATVADLYELLGESGNFQDEKWGWMDMRGAGVSRIKNGYLLDLPRPEPLD